MEKTGGILERKPRPEEQNNPENHKDNCNSKILALIA